MEFSRQGVEQKARLKRGAAILGKNQGARVASFCGSAKNKTTASVCGPYQGDDDENSRSQKKFVIGCFAPIIKVLVPTMCFALPCVVTLEMEAIDGGGGRGGREGKHQHLREGSHLRSSLLREALNVGMERVMLKGKC